MVPVINIKGARKAEPAVTGTAGVIGVGVATSGGVGLQVGPKVGWGVEVWAKTGPEERLKKTKTKADTVNNLFLVSIDI